MPTPRTIHAAGGLGKLRIDARHFMWGARHRWRIARELLNDDV
jgi:hypothetical protein